MSEPGDQLRIEDAKCLLHVARDGHHIDPQTNRLSQSRVTLQQLQGGPSRQGKRRSISTLMMCNQETAVLIAAAERLSRDAEFRAAPRGAAASLDDIRAIEVDGHPAFTIEPEEEVGQPGHVSLRFAQYVLPLSDPIQRDLRVSLIKAFGTVALVADLCAARC